MYVCMYVMYVMYVCEINEHTQQQKRVQTRTQSDETVVMLSKQSDDYSASKKCSSNILSQSSHSHKGISVMRSEGHIGVGQDVSDCCFAHACLHCSNSVTLHLFDETKNVWH